MVDYLDAHGVSAVTSWACHIQQHKRQKSLRLWAQGRDASDLLRSGRNSVEAISGLAGSIAAVVAAIGALLP